MADLKAGTTIGGTLVWTQGNFPLYPTGNTLLYKTFKIYSENDKPQAVDNDFVSKAQGGTFQGAVRVANNLEILSPGAYQAGGFALGNGDGASYTTANLDITSWWGIGIRSTASGARSIIIDARAGSIGTKGSITADSTVTSKASPTLPEHLTRKDYVDGLIANSNNNANTKVSKAGDTMSGNLTVPRVFVTSAATESNQVPWLGQVIQRGVILDYGTY